MSGSVPRVKRVAIIGAGPAGLMAAEQLLGSGLQVEIFDAMPSAARKFLMAGKGGLNITHSEALPGFVQRYGTASGHVAHWLQALSPEALRQWVHGLGIETFVGSSGRVFPAEMKAAPLLRAWLHRLREGGVRLHMRHRWLDWRALEGGYELLLHNPEGECRRQVDALILALGGGSWARLGSDGAWLPVLQRHGVAVAPLRPANCGFEVEWSPVLRELQAGAAVKNVAVWLDGEEARPLAGEFTLTEYGVEGGVIYALSAPLRDALQLCGRVRLMVDLLPDHSPERVVAELGKPRGKLSLSNHLRRRLGLSGAKMALLRECLDKAAFNDPQQLAEGIKALPIAVRAPRPLDEAISSAGGIELDGLDGQLMLRDHPGIFCAGEMLDWEAPTGGYLLTACLASGVVAGRGVRSWLDQGRS